MENFLESLILFITKIGEKPNLIGFVLAFAMAIFRTRKSQGKADWSEALMCSGLTVGASSFLDWLSLPQGFAVGIGAFIGYMGTNFIKELIINRFNKESQD